jgi:TetR/AcrR family transcriptional regulator, mexCD-oprJ operon repressor
VSPRTSMRDPKQPLLSIQDRTRSAIIEAAAHAFAEQGFTARLDDIASSAGVSRATLYRYFSSREDLIEAMVDEAYEEVVQRVRDAKVDEAPFPEALCRVARAASLTGAHFVALQTDNAPVRPHHLDEEFEATMYRLFERGKEEGYLRNLPTAWLRRVFRAIVIEGLHYASAEGLGTEDAAVVIVDQYLAGAGTGLAAEQPS